MSNKAAIISLQNRIAPSSKALRLYSMKIFRQYLLDVVGYKDVHLITELSVTDKDPEPYFVDIDSINLCEYDVYAYHSVCSYLGGNVHSATLKTVKQLKNYKKYIYYVLGDPELPLVNFAAKMNRIGVLSDEYVLPFRNLKWHVLFCGANYKKYLAHVNKHSSYYKLDRWPNEIWIPEATATNIDLHNRVVLHDYDPKNYPINNLKKPFDLVYWGVNRPDRSQYIKKYYTESNTQLNTKLVGFYGRSLTASKKKKLESLFKQPNINIYPQVQREDLIPALQDALCTVIIGDVAHNENILTPRFFESLTANLLTFIHLDYDPKGAAYDSDTLRDFLYVETYEELVEKITFVKNNLSFLLKLIRLQQKQLLIYKQNTLNNGWYKEYSCKVSKK